MLTNFGVIPLFWAIVASVVGWQLKDMVGAIVGFFLGVGVGVQALISMYEDLQKSSMQIKTDIAGITLSYVNVEKRIAWSDISGVRLTRSIFWRNLLHVKSADT